MKTIKIIFAHTFPKEKGKILKNTSNCIFQKNRKRRTVFSDILPTFVAASHQTFSAFFTPGNRIMNASESSQTRERILEILEPIQKAHPYSVLHNHSQCQSTWHSGFQRENQKGLCLCVHMCDTYLHIQLCIFKCLHFLNKIK